MLPSKIFPSHYRDVPCSFGFRAGNNSIVSNSSFLHRPRAKNSLSLSLSVFLPSLSLFLFLLCIYIYIYKKKPHDENLTDPRSSIYRCLLVPKSTRVILVGIYLHVKNHTFFNTRVSIDREKKPKSFITLYSISIHCTRFIVR